MEHAKRMVLVDEKLADHFFRKQDQNLKRPTEQLAKHNLSKEMRLGLNDESTPEDIRAKQYQQTLSRFLNMKRKLPDEPLIDLNTTSIHCKNFVLRITGFGGGWSFKYLFSVLEQFGNSKHIIQRLNYILGFRNATFR
jgi:hypothetical protein